VSESTELDQAAIRARLEAATPGPWEAVVLGSEGYDVRACRPRTPGRLSRVRVARCGYEEWEVDKANAEFIAHARTDIELLLEENARLRRWKAEALPVIAGLQDLGRALDLPIGERITAPAAAEAAQSLRATVQQLSGANDDLREVIADRKAKQEAAEGALARLRADVEAVVTDRGAGDFAPLLPKLRAALDTADTSTDTTEGDRA
jgi:hypothetical protein